MATAKTSFRLSPRLIKLMDALVKDPPAALCDPKRGAPRNRTELIEALVLKHAPDKATKAR